MSDIRCALVGLGRIGSLLEDDPLREKPCTHAGAIAENPDCVLAGGCDIDADRRALFAETWGCSEVHDDVDRMLDAVRPHILCIATHPDSHRRMVERAAVHSVPVVICEKPLAGTLRDARAIARLHHRRRVTVVTNHERRYSADYLMARAAVVDGRFGNLVGVRGTLYFGRTARHDRVLLHDGTHMVDIINFLCGGVMRPAGRFGTMRSRRSSAFLYARVGRIPVIIEVGAERDHLVFEVELSFERGRVRVGNGVFSFEGSRASPHYQGYRSLADSGETPPTRTGYFSGMIADAVACVREPQRVPVSSALDGYQVMRFIRSVAAGR